MSDQTDTDTTGTGKPGEGDREAAERYNQATRDFVDSGKVDRAARRAAEQDADEARDSEARGRARAREEDPEVDRDYRQPTEPTD